MRLYVRQEEGSHLQELVRVARRVQSLQEYLIHVTLLILSTKHYIIVHNVWLNARTPLGKPKKQKSACRSPIMQKQLVAQPCGNRVVKVPDSRAKKRDSTESMTIRIYGQECKGTPQSLYIARGCVHT